MTRIQAASRGSFFYAVTGCNGSLTDRNIKMLPSPGNVTLEGNSEMVNAVSARL